MKRNMKRMILLAVLSLAVTGCGQKKTKERRPKIPADWYRETLQYYREGFDGGWKNERSDLNVSDEMKDGNNKFGYLLQDLDGDGASEVLIGLMDDSAETKIIDVFIWHSDRGAFRILHGGEGYYIYLCEQNVLRMDSWRGAATDTKYMKYDSKNNSFTELSEEAVPQKLELTAF
ncbi:MAG: membrane lipoprotein lipid attachment site-containing protein [Oscillospiraceae bacterium]|nr:membrane lipoprotein lipid attachment site-containing protein [Oscillospiraceae bacterium]